MPEEITWPPTGTGNEESNVNASGDWLGKEVLEGMEYFKI